MTPTRWWVKVIVMPGVAMICVAATFVVSAVRQSCCGAKAKSLGFGVLFLLYPGICNKAFATFECRELIKGERAQILEADDRFLCNGEEISQLRPLSMAVIVFFGFGVPMIFSVVLMKSARKYRREGSQHNTEVAARLAAEFNVDQTVADFVLRDVTTMGESFSFLLDAYTFQCYYWETLDMLRKLLLVGLVLLVKRGSVAEHGGVGAVSCIPCFASQYEAVQAATGQHLQSCNRIARVSGNRRRASPSQRSIW